MGPGKGRVYLPPHSTGLSWERCCRRAPGPSVTATGSPPPLQLLSWGGVAPWRAATSLLTRAHTKTQTHTNPWTREYESYVYTCANRWCWLHTHRSCLAISLQVASEKNFLPRKPEGPFILTAFTTLAEVSRPVTPCRVEAPSRAASMDSLLSPILEEGLRETGSRKLWMAFPEEGVFTVCTPPM